VLSFSLFTLLSGQLPPFLPRLLRLFLLSLLGQWRSPRWVSVSCRLQALLIAIRFEFVSYLVAVADESGKRVGVGVAIAVGPGDCLGNVVSFNKSESHGCFLLLSSHSSVGSFYHRPYDQRPQVSESPERRASHFVAASPKRTSFVMIDCALR
jgi:hypothetical protein